jgi:hypothetical protein
MSLIVALLMLLAPQQASAQPALEVENPPFVAWQDGLFRHGVWTGQCWAAKDGAMCRAAGGQAGKLWVMIERTPAQIDIYVSGACTITDPAPQTLPQSMLTGANRVTVLRTAIDLVVLKTNHECKTQEVFAGTDDDLAALLKETDAPVAGAAK